MDIQIKKVETKADLKKFIKLKWQIYKNDPYWVPPLISDQLNFLDKNKGVFFTLGEAEYFIAYDGGKPVGRISAHINHQFEKYHDKETGFFGFFECENNQKAANALFDAACDWLRKKGKTKILGPQSFSLYDESGMLYDGYDSIPVILLSYNPPYYNDLVKNAGLVKSIDWYAFLVNKSIEIKKTFYKIRDRILKQGDIKIVPLDMKNFDNAVKDVGIIFSDAWMENWGHVPLTEKQLEHLAKELRMIVIPEMTYLAYIDDQVVGFSLTIKDANPALKKANGRLWPFGLLKILLNINKTKRVRTIAMGVLKEHRHRGLDIVFYLNTIEKGREMGYEDSECSIIVETNQRMIGALKDLNAEQYKTYRFYEKNLQE